MTWTVLLAAGKRAAAFFAQPPGSWISAALIALALLWGVHHAGYKAGEAACSAKQQIAAQRQERAATAAVAASEARTAADVRIDAQNQETVRYVVKTVYARPDAGVECIPAAIADRLRRLQ